MLFLFLSVTFCTRISCYNIIVSMLVCLLVLQLRLGLFVACYDRLRASKSAYSKQTAVILIKLLNELCDFVIVGHVPYDQNCRISFLSNTVSAFSQFFHSRNQSFWSFV